MRRLKLLLPAVAGFLLLAGFSFGVSDVFALEIRSGKGDEVNVGADEYIDDDLILVGEDIKVEGIVTGDVIVSGNIVEVSGIVGGDLYAAGARVEVSGSVGKSLKAGGGQIELTGEVGRNVYIGGGFIDLSSDAYVAEDVLAAGGQVNIDGWIGDDLRVCGGMIDVSATVEDDVLADGGSISIDEEKVSGDIELNLGDDTKDVAGSMLFVGYGMSVGALLLNVLVTLLWFVGLYIVGWLMIRYVPVKTNDIVLRMTKSGKEFLTSFLVGLLVAVLTPFAILILLLTVVGAPLAILLSVGLMFFFIFGWLWADMAVGKVVLDKLKFKSKSLNQPLLAGLVIRAVTWVIPCVGGLYAFGTLCASLGAAVRMKLDRMAVSMPKVKAKNK